MHGFNPVTKAFNQEGTLLKVVEIFYTLQGEGPQAGWPAIFVRLAHCNLRCHFCDTSFDEGSIYRLDTLVEQIGNISSAMGCELVVITGGEPLLQNITPLVRALNRENIMVSVETAGTMFYESLLDLFLLGVMRNTIVCSPKTPQIHLRMPDVVGAWKYVLRAGEADPNDGLPAMATQRFLAKDAVDERPQRLFRPPLGHRAPIYLQPMDEGDKNKNERNQALVADNCMKYGYRMSLQTHKIVGLP